MRPVLDVKGLTMDFGGLRAIDEVDLQIRQGEIVALIGPNGAGKTTFFNCITGIYEPTGGMIIIHPMAGESQKLTGLKPNQITSKGLARTFQNIRLFQNMTVLENVMVARHCRTKSGILGSILKGKRTRKEEKEMVSFSYDLLKRFHLEKQVNDLAKELPYGAQRRLEIARAMATEPFLLLLDEPAAGMNPRETRELDRLISRIRDEDGISILLIEHDMRLVMSISDRVYVMDYGELIASGTPEEVSSDPSVIKAYLGESGEEENA
ncbi:MAG: ABC transporter ATP-binding protein [Thermodesulfobacteriota bacterium]|nr:ABC transporter ATP-binding protein [Thermodesulfobacteriota bacterium]